MLNSKMYGTVENTGILHYYKKHKIIFSLLFFSSLSSEFSCVASHVFFDTVLVCTSVPDLTDRFRVMTRTCHGNGSIVIKTG